MGVAGPAASLNKANTGYPGIYLENKELSARFQIQNGNAFMATKKRQMGMLLVGCLARALILKSADLDSPPTGYLLELFILPKHLFSDSKKEKEYYSILITQTAKRLKWENHCDNIPRTLKC